MIFIYVYTDYYLERREYEFYNSIVTLFGIFDYYIPIYIYIYYQLDRREY